MKLSYNLYRLLFNLLEKVKFTPNHSTFSLTPFQEKTFKDLITLGIIEKPPNGKNYRICDRINIFSAEAIQILINVPKTTFELYISIGHASTAIVNEDEFANLDQYGLIQEYLETNPPGYYIVSLV